MTATRRQLEQALEVAVRAPSIHNTQPWRLRLVLDGPLPVVEVRDGPDRAVPAIDPSGRERAISCGALLGYLQVALRGGGLDGRVELLPDDEDPGLLARVAVVDAEPAADDDRALLAATARRATYRGAMTDEPVDDEDVRALVAEAGHGTAAVRRLDEDAWLAAAVLQSHADDLQRAEAAYHEELARWTGRDAGSSDGIPAAAVSARGDKPYGTWTLREFDEAGTGEVAVVQDDAESPEVLVVSTPSDDPADLVEAGQTLARVLLRAEVLDLAVSPMTQVTEVPFERDLLRARLGGVLRPQVVLRVGHGERTSPTPRRPLDDVLEVVGA